MPKIVHSEWYKGGIGGDEATGSIFDARNMSIRQDLRSIGLSRSLNKGTSTKRGAGSNVLSTSFVNIDRPNGFFTDDQISILSDGSIESGTYGELSENIQSHGPLYYNTNKYVGGKVYSNGLVIAVRDDGYIDAFKFDASYFDDTLLTSGGNPTYDMSAWTKGATWTGTTEVSITEVATRSNMSFASTTGAANTTYRIAVLMGDVTSSNKNLTVKRGSTTIGNVRVGNKSTVFEYTVGGSPKTDVITLEPASGFGGTVKGVLVQRVDTTKRKLGITMGSVGSNVSIVKQGPLVYIGTADKAYLLDTSSAISGRLTSTALDLPDSNYIIGMSVIGQYINVYVNDGYDGIKYIWNGIDKFPDQQIIREQQTITSMGSNGNEDYLIIGNSLYISVGYQRQKVVKQTKSLFGTQRGKFDFRKILGFDGDLVIIGTSGGYYVYGSMGPGLPTAIMHEQTLGGNPIVYSGGIISTNEGNGTTYTVSTFGYKKSGYFVALPVTFGLLGDKKVINKIRVSGYIPDDKTTINISVSINNTYYWTVGVTSVTTTPEVGSVYKYSNQVRETTLEVIKTDIAGGIGKIYFITKETDSSIFFGTLSKVSGIGDNTLQRNNPTNFTPLKTITSDTGKYFREYIEANDFVGIKAEDIHKLQIRIDIDQTQSEIERTPAHITDIIYIADIITDGYQ